jgi:hypothetical protein
MTDLKKCTICGASLHIRNKTGKCRKCYKTNYEKEYYTIRYKTDKDFANKQIERVSIYNKNNSKDRLLYNKQYRYNREQIDISYKLSNYLRSRLTHAIKGNFKTGSAVKDLGCSVEELKAYIESKFQEGMSWDNYGFYGWHIDHIRPLASFDLSNPEELKKACHYTNLQPLWAEENLSKGDKI